MPKATQYLPIIYVRGYASTKGAVDETTDDPFYGFNAGSTHIRINAENKPDKYIFEGPVVRLMTDYGYKDVFYHGSDSSDTYIQAQSAEGFDAAKTIWILRYYDSTTKTFGTDAPERLLVEDCARMLRDLIDTVIKKTKSPKVFLVAHSMGGLICRSLIEKIYPEEKKDATDYVARLFTYASPHGGIHARAMNWLFGFVRDNLIPFDADTFGPDRLYQMLTPNPAKKTPSGYDPRIATNKDFPLDNIFCLIGTNAKDYSAGALEAVTGPQGDGLVQIDSAFVWNGADDYAHRAYVHRSHSGRYGIVNSEEGFQNLERFLFGTIQAILTLNGLVIPESDVHNVSYQMDVRVAVRGLPVAMNEQTAAHFAPLILNPPDKSGVPQNPTGPIHIYTQFLNDALIAPDETDMCRFAISLRLFKLKTKNGKNIDTSTLLDGMADWADLLLVDLILNKRKRIPAQAKFAWRSENTGDGPNEPTTEIHFTPTAGKSPKGWVANIALPSSAQKQLGDAATFGIEAYEWTID